MHLFVEQLTNVDFSYLDAKRGVASLCLGGGNAVSMLIERA